MAFSLLKTERAGLKINIDYMKHGETPAALEWKKREATRSISTSPQFRVMLFTTTGVQRRQERVKITLLRCNT